MGDVSHRQPEAGYAVSSAATLIYKVTARRKGTEQYVALISSSSTYVRDRSWQLVVHQQTPA